MTTPDEVQTRGPFVAEYSGVGRFTFADDRLSEDARFWIGQAHNGNIVICSDESMSAYVFANLFSPLRSFSGLTTSGLYLETNDRLYTISQQSLQSDESMLRTIVLASEIRLTVTEPPAITGVRYGLTNFLFDGTEACDSEPRDRQRVLRLKLDYLGKPAVGYICKIPSYSSARKTLHAVGGIQVTAELVVDLSLSEITGDDCDRIADVLCRVLSVARGTHIAWIYKVSLDSTGNPVAHVHSNNVTRNYHSLPLLSDNPEDAEPTRVFAETTFPAYLEKSSEYMLDRGSLDTYLEAKLGVLGQEYLEMSALKLTVAMEMLAHAYLRAKRLEGYETIMPPDDFQNCLQDLETVVEGCLTAKNLKPKTARRIAGRVKELNNAPFKDILDQLFKGIDLNVVRSSKNAMGDAELFACCRNSLAHTGQFLSTTRPPGKPCPFAQGSAGNKQAYFFMQSLVDRVFLRLLDYDGPYIDWRNPNDRKRRMHVKE